MTLEKSSNWWDTPGLGELSMTASSIPTGLGAYAAGTKLLKLNPRVAAAAGVLAGGGQAVHNIMQAKANGKAGLVTPSSPVADIGRSLLTGGMGVLGGAGMASIANTAPPNARNMAAIGTLIAAGDFFASKRQSRR